MELNFPLKIVSYFKAISFFLLSFLVPLMPSNWRPKKLFSRCTFQQIITFLNYIMKVIYFYLLGSNWVFKLWFTGKLRWMWTFCHLLSRFCQTRVSSDWCVWASPCLKVSTNNKVKRQYLSTAKLRQLTCQHTALTEHRLYKQYLLQVNEHVDSELLCWWLYNSCQELNEFKK